MSAFRTWKNTSDFPDAWAKPVCEWIAARYQIPAGTKDIIIRRTSRGGHGHACGRRVVCSINRRKPRKDWTYCTISWAKRYEVAGALEAFVFLAAHELYHVAPAGRTMWLDMKTSGRHDWRQGMEQRTDAAAWETLLAYRQERRRFIAKYRASLQRYRQRQAACLSRKVAAKSHDAKLAKARAALAVWLRKAKLAAGKVKKYQRRVNYYQRAACPG